MGIDSSEQEAKEASLSKKKFVQSASMLEKLVAMNTMETELRQYNLAIIKIEYVAVLRGHILIKY